MARPISTQEFEYILEYYNAKGSISRSCRTIRARDAEDAYHRVISRAPNFHSLKIKKARREAVKK